MRRIWTLGLYLTRDLFYSLAGIAPAAAALAFGLIAFEYGMDQPQFITVGGLGIGTICLLTVLLLASRANRAASYPLLARLHRRGELLMALVLSGLVITAVFGLLIAGGNLVTGRLTLSFPSLLWIVPTWSVLWLLAASLALLLSALVGRGGSHVAGYMILAMVLVINDQKERLASAPMNWLPPQVLSMPRLTLVVGRIADWLSGAVSSLLWPINSLLAQASAGVHDRIYLVALALTLVYALGLYVLATRLFTDKDLLWVE